MKDKIWIVHWGSGTLDDDGNVSSFCGVDSVHSSKKAAKNALVQSKDRHIAELRGSYLGEVSSEEELQELLDDFDLRVYGSAADEYFEIDYTAADVRNEIYIGISEQELK